MKFAHGIAALFLMGSLVGLSGCVSPDGGYHERRGEDDGRQYQSSRNCDQQLQDDCRDQEHH